MEGDARDRRRGEDQELTSGRAIGRLEAQAEAGQNQRRTIFEKLDEIAVAVAPLARHLDDDQARFDAHDERLTVLEAAANRSRGMVRASKVIGAALATSIMALIAGAWAIVTEFGWFKGH